MTWIAEPIGYANPDYYVDATTSTEKQLRAEFAQYHQLREIAPFGLTQADTADLNSRADDLAMRWGHHESPRWRSMWQTLQAAVMGWEARPDLARRNFDELARAQVAGDLAIDDELWRSLQQARAITGHGHDSITGSEQDATRLYPNLDPETFAKATIAPSGRDETDRRSAVERSLGAPRDLHTEALTIAQIDAVIAETDAALDDEEHAGDRDSGHEARAALLPRTIREAPITYSYAESEAWELRQAALLREVQDLACEHSNVADSFDGRDDQARITRLEALGKALAAARRDAMRAGVAPADVDHAYIVGRGGLYWSNEPSHPRLGRIAQLTEERDRARAEASAKNGTLTAHRNSAREPDPGRSAVDAFSSPEQLDGQAVPTVDAGMQITEAIDAVLAESDIGDWGPESVSPDPINAEQHQTDVQI